MVCSGLKIRPDTRHSAAAACATNSTAYECKKADATAPALVAVRLDLQAQLLSLARAAARSARAALQPSDSCVAWLSRQLRMAPLARSMLAQNFCTSAEQAARICSRASG